MHWKDKQAKLEQLQERVGFASDPDLGSPELLAEAKRQLEEYKASLQNQTNKVTCPSGHEMVKRNGKYGEFYGCSHYPRCKNTLSLYKAEQQLKKRGNNGSKPNGFVPSHFQQAVFDFITGGSGNAFVGAVAGSGKTTLLVEGLKLTKGSVLFCAFNRHIRDELARRAPRHVKVSTIHSIGLQALSAFSKTKPEIDNRKLYNIVKDLLPHEQERPLRSPLMRLVSMCKKTLTDYTDVNAIEDIADYYDIELNGDAEKILPLVPIAMELCKSQTATIDFDDMIWLPNVLNLRMQTYDWVFVDECQDLSAAQLALVLRSKKLSGRIIAVGDENQSIYGFTGADVNAVKRLVDALEAKTLPLSITYRCAKSIVRKAQALVPQIEAADWAKEGEVTSLSYERIIQQARDKDLIICRINAPLVKACYTFIRNGTKAVIRGRDIGKGLINFIDRLEPINITDLMDKIREYRHKETAKLERAGKEQRIEALHDRCDTLIALCDGIDTLGQLVRQIESIFDDKTKDGIILSSIHRSKGDEADTVYILRPSLLPHPLAVKPWQQLQEANLEYVAYTRAKNTLVLEVERRR